MDTPEPIDELTLRGQLLAEHQKMNATLKSNAFWHVNIGHILTLIGMAVGLIGMYYKFDNRVSNLEEKELAVSALIAVMDNQGTHASQKGIYQESEFSKATERRVAELEREWHEASPKLERINANMDWLVKQQQQHP